MMDAGYLSKKRISNKKAKGKKVTASRKEKEEEFEEDNEIE